MPLPTHDTKGLINSCYGLTTNLYGFFQFPQTHSLKKWFPHAYNTHGNSKSIVELKLIQGHNFHIPSLKGTLNILLKNVTIMSNHGILNLLNHTWLKLCVLNLNGSYKGANTIYGHRFLTGYFIIIIFNVHGLKLMLWFIFLMHLKCFLHPFTWFHNFNFNLFSHMSTLHNLNHSQLQEFFLGPFIGFINWHTHTHTHLFNKLCKGYRSSIRAFHNNKSNLLTLCSSQISNNNRK